jgi:hypothetical protein
MYLFKNINTNNVIIGKIVHIFKNMLKKKSFKKSFLWKNQIIHKGPIYGWVLCHH